MSNELPEVGFCNWSARGCIYTFGGEGRENRGDGEREREIIEK